MDKKLILAVAGAGKTTYIIDNICNGDKRVLIVTYTEANYKNIIQKIRNKNEGIIPDGISVFTYFKFLYSFCYKPFLSDEIQARGINYESNKNMYAKSNRLDYYLDSQNRLYSNRIAYLLDRDGVMPDIKQRLEKYFDYFVLDEVQDISGRDFNFLEQIMDAGTNMLFVGDFYQHTFSTSADGNVNKSLYDDCSTYIKRFSKKQIVVDGTTLIKSWRCGEQVCEFVRDNLGIEIYSNKGVTGEIIFADDAETVRKVWNDFSIIKLHYKKASDYGKMHKNWGDAKGEDCYNDVCIMLNKKTMDLYKKNSLSALPATTKNKLYVAMTRARGNVYLVDETQLKKIDL
ncbi:AAA family ATPase [Butyrivibrio sp. WCE2006]|uniref:AAA family ATPase n=1 Tax=Butyrivibrio sp. WCE2006 TaxID=1410611 RepID=UPI0005D24A7E|nr:AAA family ATPase [Butyrivibrio sp. WCE2006]